MSSNIVAPRLDELEPTPLRWLWPGYLPLGKLTLIDGDPGQGKSLMSLDLAARVTRGDKWPDSTPGGDPAGVVLVGCEDDLNNTVLPRLAALGADLTRIAAFQGHEVDGKLVGLPSFPRDAEALGRLVEKHAARLVVMDPLMAFIDPMFSTINDQAIRQALLPLMQMAEETGCNLSAIRHLNKTGAGRAMYRGSGSIGIVGCSRCAYLVGRSPDDPSVRVLACLKTNVGELPPSLGFRVFAGTGLQVDWLGAVDYAADDLLAVPGKKTTAQDRAAAFLQVQLADGPVEFQILLARAKSAGLSERTLFRAKKVVAARSFEEGSNKARKHFWTLQKPDTLDGLLGQQPSPSP
jgi:hypothetical protein